ncbi:unnamed protein product [Paramecium sonneborni]|uniref:Transmembrane protein n=1 Tax=Paramecium sonneborni TaxID=65129 RepID=A0A8S1MXW6_9CILI|nr:unnamed protein product [Paramecium sonneborni]
MQKLLILVLLLVSRQVNCQEPTPQSTENRVFQCVFIIVFVLIVIMIIRAIINRRRQIILVGLVEEVPPQNIVVINQIPANPNQSSAPAQNQQFYELAKQSQLNQILPQQQQQQLPPQYPPQMNQNYTQQPIQYQQNMQCYSENTIYLQQGIPISQPQGQPK